MGNLSGKKVHWSDFGRELANAMWGEGGWFYDLEGNPAPNSLKKVYEEAHKLYSIEPTVEGVKGTIILFGTAGEIEAGADFAEAFYNPANYKTEEHPLSEPSDPYAPVTLKCPGFFIPCYKPKNDEDME